MPYNLRPGDIAWTGYVIAFALGAVVGWLL